MGRQWTCIQLAAQRATGRSVAAAAATNNSSSGNSGNINKQLPLTPLTCCL